MKVMTTEFDPAKHPTGNDGRFVTRTAKPAEVTLGAPRIDEAPLVPPSGCGVCGEESRTHPMKFGGAHIDNPHFVEPSAEQRKERVIAAIARQQTIRESGGADAGSASIAEEVLVHPSGCSVCGAIPGHHGLTSRGGQGLHTYQEPSMATRKERIMAASAARTAAVAEGRTGIHFSPRTW